jgi:uncharacterized membrane protein
MVSQKQPDRRRSRFSHHIYFFIILILSVCGLAVSAYLAIAHYRNYNDIEYKSFCAISRSLNCDTVAQSPYAVVLGVPLAVWGMLGYVFFSWVVLFFRRCKDSRRGWAVIVGVLGFFCISSLYLAGISKFIIRSYCLMCIITYAVNFLLLYFSWLAMKRFGDETFRLQLKGDMAFLRNRFRQAGLGGTIFLVVFGSAVLFYPNYWTFQALPNSVFLDSGVTEEGSPWIGAKEPSLTIVEFTDYMCFQCAKMHNHLRQLVNRFPDKIRLVHRHFPLDERINPIVKEAFHTNSGLVSLFAILSQDSGKFWQVSDRLFRDARQKKISIRKIAEDMDIDLSNFEKRINDGDMVKKLQEDIRAGLKLEITATPSYLIDGKVYSGTIPDDVLSVVTRATDD